MSEKSTIAGLISKAAKKLRDDFEHIRETISHSGEKGGERVIAAPCCAEALPSFRTGA